MRSRKPIVYITKRDSISFKYLFECKQYNYSDVFEHIWQGRNAFLGRFGKCDFRLTGELQDDPWANMELR